MASDARVVHHSGLGPLEYRVVLCLEDDDFFGESENHTPAWQACVEAHRGAVLDWAAATLVARNPTSAAFRGPKGVGQCRLDLDRMLKQIVSPESGIGRAAWRRWMMSTVFAPRGQREAELEAGVAVLCEALVRLVPWPEGVTAAQSALDELGCMDHGIRKLVAQRAAAG